MIERLDFYDVFIVDLDEGDILYSAAKEVDFATNLFTGPYRTSNLALLAEQLRKNSDLTASLWVDFVSYRPTFGAPAGFVGVPLSEDGFIVGALIFQLPLDEIDYIMTGDKGWKEDGLGETGETYLVGDDRTMRSTSRFFIEDQDAYKEAMLGSGQEPQELQNMLDFGTTVLQQDVRTEAVTEALEGKSDTRIIKDYRGVDVLSSFSPLKVKGLHWAIFSEKDQAEVNAVTAEFNRQMFIYTSILVLVITLIAVWFSSRFVMPVELLTLGTQRISEGDFEHRVEIDTQDEFKVLADSFNQMVGHLEDQKKELKMLSEDSDRLLKKFVPEVFVNRLKAGERGFADTYQNVAIIAVDLIGFIEYNTLAGANESVKLLDGLIHSFDTAALANLVEPITTIGDNYFAVCGLFEPRLDHSKRIASFALEVKSIVRRFTQTTEADLDVQISIHRGEVVAGMIGDEHITFDVWGRDVKRVFQMISIALQEGVLASEEIMVRLKGIYDFSLLEEKVKGEHAVYLMKESK